MEKTIERRSFLGLNAAVRAGADECHISSILIHVQPDLQDDVAARIDAFRGVETQQPRRAGKLIATLETASTAEIMDLIETIQDLPGVVAVALVFHQWERVASEA